MVNQRGAVRVLTTTFLRVVGCGHGPISSNAMGTETMGVATVSKIMSEVSATSPAGAAKGFRTGVARFVISTVANFR